MKIELFAVASVIEKQYANCQILVSAFQKNMQTVFWLSISLCSVPVTSS